MSEWTVYMDLNGQTRIIRVRALDEDHALMKARRKYHSAIALAVSPVRSYEEYVQLMGEAE